MAFRKILNGIHKSEYFFKDAFVLLNIHDLILAEPGQKCIYKKEKVYSLGCPVFNMLALRIDFSKIK